MNTYQLEIITPETVIFKGPVTSTVVPGTDGKLGILAHHAPLISSLEPGPVKVVGADGTTRVFAIGGGFVEVADNVARIVADVGEDAEDIDEERARKAEERARQRLREHAPDIDFLRAELALARALARIQALGALRGIRGGPRERGHARG